MYPSKIYNLLYRPEEVPVEDVLTQLSTDELLRMLELLDMLESKAPIQASDREMGTMQYLLKNYPH